MNLATLRRQHDELDAIAAELSEAVGRTDSARAAALRWRLARSLTAHLALEDLWLYPAMRNATDTKARDVAVRLGNDMGHLADAFTAYMSSWTNRRISDQWRDFAAETLTFLRALQMRIRLENMQLYPVAATILRNGQGGPSDTTRLSA